MLYWILIALGAATAILFTGIWKKEPFGTNRKRIYALIAYISYGVYLIGFIGHLAPMIGDQEPSLLFTALVIVPIIMFAIIFFEQRQENSEK